jgi:hypothetical protein
VHRPSGYPAARDPHDSAQDRGADWLIKAKAAPGPLAGEIPLLLPGQGMPHRIQSGRLSQDDPLLGLLLKENLAHRHVPDFNPVRGRNWRGDHQPRDKPGSINVATGVATHQKTWLFAGVRHRQLPLDCAVFDAVADTPEPRSHNSGSRGRRFKSCQPDQRKPR